MDGDNICYEQSKGDEQEIKIDGKDDVRNRVLSSEKSRHLKSHKRTDLVVKTSLKWNDGAVNKKFVLSDRNGQLSSSTMCLKSYFDYLPEELFVEILKKCPKNLIHRSKCVSKRWLELISRDVILDSKPPFALFHQHNGICSVFSDNPIFKSSKFSFAFLSHSVKVLGSSNGFLLCKPYTHANTYYVYNLLTEDWVIVPLPPNNCSDTYLVGFVCKFRTRGRCDFRIVQIPDERWPNGSLKLDTYVSEDRIWKESFFGLYADNKLFRIYSSFSSATIGSCEAVACNGLLHWVNNHGNILVSYPFEVLRKYKVIMAPNKVVTKRYLYKPRIGVSNGRLRYFERGLENYFVWELEDYDTGKWSLVQDFYFNEMDIRSHEDSSPLIAFHPFDQDIVCLELRGRIVYYNISSKKMLTICKKDASRRMSIFPIVLPSWPFSVRLH